MNVRNVPRSFIKTIVQGFSVIAVLPLAAAAGFGHFAAGFQTCGQLLAMAPGLPGDYLRTAYYFLTLRRCSLTSRVSFGSFFAQSDSHVGPRVYIGAYSVIGACQIGERTQIASHVQVLSGRHQHLRNVDGQLLGAREECFQAVLIGPEGWTGAAAIIMAGVGAGTTVGAAALVNRCIPAGVVAVGNLARLPEKVPQ